MKKSLVFVFLCTLGALHARPVVQEDKQLKDLETRIYERSAELPELKKQLKSTAKGSEDARRLRSKINQYEEFIKTAQAELDARRKKPTLIQIPVAQPIVQTPVIQPAVQVPTEEIIYKDVTVIPEELPIEQLQPVQEETTTTYPVVEPYKETPVVQEVEKETIIPEEAAPTVMQPIKQEVIPVVEERATETEAVIPEMQILPVKEEIIEKESEAIPETPALPAEKPLIKPIKPVLVTPIAQIENKSLIVEIPKIAQPGSQNGSNASLIAEIRGGNNRLLSVKGQDIEATIGEKRISSSLPASEENPLKKRRIEISE